MTVLRFGTGQAGNRPVGHHAGPSAPPYQQHPPLPAAVTVRQCLKATGRSNLQILDADHRKITGTVGQTRSGTGGTQLVRHQQRLVVRRGLAGVKSAETPRTYAGCAFDGRGDWSRAAQDRNDSRQSEAQLAFTGRRQRASKPGRARHSRSCDPTGCHHPRAGRSAGREGQEARRVARGARGRQSGQGQGWQTKKGCWMHWGCSP